MADNRSMNKCAIFLALIACSHAIVWAEGRQLKYKEKHETAKDGSKDINLLQNDAGIKEDSQSKKPSVRIPSAENAVTVTRKREIFPPMSFVASTTEYQDDFRPTTPGNSPGVGHKHAKEEEDVESKVEGDHSLNGGHSVTGYEDDFRPTAPGHSPGAGHKHAKEEEDVESKVEGDHSLNGGHSVTGYKDDFRPTAPGHSPGAGHLLSNKSAEQKVTLRSCTTNLCL